MRVPVEDFVRTWPRGEHTTDEEQEEDDEEEGVPGVHPLTPGEHLAGTERARTLHGRAVQGLNISSMILL